MWFRIALGTGLGLVWNLETRNRRGRISDASSRAWRVTKRTGMWRNLCHQCLQLQRKFLEIIFIFRGAWTSTKKLFLDTGKHFYSMKYMTHFDSLDITGNTPTAPHTSWHASSARAPSSVVSWEEAAVDTPVWTASGHPLHHPKTCSTKTFLALVNVVLHRPGTQGQNSGECPLSFHTSCYQGIGEIWMCLRVLCIMTKDNKKNKEMCLGGVKLP